jgi:hypothetical protein
MNFSPSLTRSLSESEDEESEGAEGVGVSQDDVDVYVIRLVNSDKSDEGQTSYPVSLERDPLRGPLGI